MHVLVATAETQGLRPTDYCWAVEGELVRLPGVTCADEACGCDRGWAGLASSRATTTCRVSDLDLDHQQLVGAFTDALRREGWLLEGEDDSWIADFVDGHLDIARSFPADAVLELRDRETVVWRTPIGRDGALG